MESLILTGPGDFHRAFSNRMKMPFGFLPYDRIPFAHTHFPVFRKSLARYIWKCWLDNGSFVEIILCVSHGNYTVQCNCYSTCMYSYCHVQQKAFYQTCTHTHTHMHIEEATETERKTSIRKSYFSSIYILKIYTRCLFIISNWIEFRINYNHWSLFCKLFSFEILC